MALMKLSQYRMTFAEGSRPDPRTIKGQITRGEIVGEKRGGLWYVDPDAEPGTKVVQRGQTNNPLVRKVLERLKRGSPLDMTCLSLATFTSGRE